MITHKNIYGNVQGIDVCFSVESVKFILKSSLQSSVEEKMYPDP